MDIETIMVGRLEKVAVPDEISGGCKFLDFVSPANFARRAKVDIETIMVGRLEKVAVPDEISGGFLDFVSSRQFCEAGEGGH